MCKAFPGPRCSYHTKKVLIQSQELLSHLIVSGSDEDAIKNARYRVLIAQKEYYATSAGKKILEEKIVQAKNNLNSVELKKLSLLLIECNSLKEQRDNAYKKYLAYKDTSNIVCLRCGKSPEEVEFYYNPKLKDGLQRTCKECKRKRTKETYDSFSEEEKKFLLQRKRIASKNGDFIRKYGITLDEYNIMLEQQKGCCKVCKNPPPSTHPTLCVDHSHYSNKVRGLLCNNCNTGVGLITDRDIDYANKAIDYLQEETNFFIRKSLDATPVSSKDSYLRRNFGISLQQYNSILSIQGGMCKICKVRPRKGKSLAVDHCHITNKIRGLLCSHCNLGIGYFKDNPSFIKESIEYVQNFNKEIKIFSDKNSAIEERKRVNQELRREKEAIRENNNNLILLRRKEAQAKIKDKPIRQPPKRNTYPPLKEIIDNIERKGYSAYARELEMADNSLRKYLRRMKVDPLPKRVPQRNSEIV